MQPKRTHYQFYVSSPNPVRLTELNMVVYPETVFELSAEDARKSSVRIALKKDPNKPDTPWLMFYDGDIPVSAGDDFDAMYAQWKQNSGVPEDQEPEIFEASEETDSPTSLPDDFNEWKLKDKLQWIKEEMTDQSLLLMLAEVGQAEVADAAAERLAILTSKASIKNVKSGHATKAQATRPAASVKPATTKPVVKS